ncbi:ras GTPase-activating protein-binding protein 1-like isoform X2 [Macrosteles quadrilineatus]|uniref:ras GTPase-activating protein-binding protein 1-like isoform X1 n=1 Tax=Macrosteles quadrilineatus TaxID=74068 RepID=UPI0023E18B31|nr:ras GTPase-activating protein-binding protein 1-like isoform X1 [Macrosteles quadrilineatus]XP_054263069.1 ras GTPase-activating protein-binding protein 1-like isoform X2 [Macrosteles quadrilineatus]
MVMEVSPSPQCVGREFVRQYYTLLNKAPTHVHRFYNNNSSFVHGGLDVFNREGKPAVGQKQIHQCIQQLNFRDCHAKITQVDSQATLGNGVVVQVTGELSNGGQPMRRFTQTFVLGAQSPKQYYVHNDIFRYQDLVFGDDDPDQESHHYEPEDEEPEHPPQSEHPQVQQQQQQESTYYQTALPPTMPTVNGTPHVEHVTEPTPVQPTPATPSYNDIIPHHVPQQPPQMQPPPPQTVPVYGAVTVSEPEQPESADIEIEDKQPQDQYTTPPPLDQDNNNPPLTQDNVSSNEPKTYASTLVKSGGGVANFNTSPSAPSKSPPSPPPPMTRLESRNNEINMGGPRGGVGMRPLRGSGPVGRGGMGRGMENRPPRQSLSEDSREYGGREEPASDGDRRRSVNSQTQYSDDHQLFLGNLPLNASENDLRDLFKTYGPIVDLRIMSKSNLKGQNGNKVPNYGFIIFERVETVQAVLNARPIFFPGENAVKLNVEEKKTKPRSDGGGGGGGGRGGGMRGGLNRGGQRGGFSRGGTGMRPGAGFTQRGGPR